MTGFDPRKDKLLNITTSDDHFESSMIMFKPPLEQYDRGENLKLNKASLASDHQYGRHKPEAVLSDDSILKHFADGAIPSSVTHSRLIAPDAQDSWNSDKSIVK